MCRRGILSRLVLAVVSVSLFSPLVLLSVPQVEGEIYINGDWVITSEEHYDNETYILNGNLYVENGGKLFFDNVTLKINCVFEGQYKILVEENGSFIIMNSIITSNNPDLPNNNGKYYWDVYGILEATSSNIAYVASQFPYGGINIFNSNNVIFICISFNFTTLYFEYSDIYIYGCVFSNPSGITLEYSSPRIIDTIVEGGAGVNIRFNSSPLLDNVTIINSPGDGLEILNGPNVMVINSTLAYNGASGGYGIEARGGSVVTLINCSVHDNVYGNYDYDPGSTIIRQNWLDLQSIDSNSGQPIPDARVLINDTYGDTVYDGYTDSDGWLRNVNLTHKIMGNGSGTFTPHNITISKDNYFANWTEVMMNESYKVTVELTPHPVPAPYTVYGRVEETAGIPAAGANISCLAPGYGRVETNTDADGYFYVNLGSIPGYVANIGDIVHIDISKARLEPLRAPRQRRRVGDERDVREPGGGDELLHSICFVVFLWDVERLPVEGRNVAASLAGRYGRLPESARCQQRAGEWEIPIAGLEAAIETSFNQGWALLAAPYHTGLTVTADDILDQINAQNGAGACTKVCNWTVTDTWETWDGSVGVDFLLDDENNPNNSNAKAWAVYATKSGSWTPL